MYMNYLSRPADNKISLVILSMIAFKPVNPEELLLQKIFAKLQKIKTMDKKEHQRVNYVI